MTEVAVQEVAQVKTDDEFAQEFAGLHEEEVERRGKLDETIFAMGDLLVRWNPDRAQLSELAKRYGYKINTLEQRRDAAHNLPKEIRNPELSYSAHVEALKIDDVEARDELIRASGGRSANLMRVAVREKREELEEVQPAKPKVNRLELEKTLSWSGGFAISDGETIAKGRVSIINGEFQLTMDTSNSLPELDAVSIKQGRQHVINGKFNI